MDKKIIDVHCSLCGGRHRYSLVEQTVAIRNAALNRRPGDRGMLKPPLFRTSKPDLPEVIAVSAVCPRTWRTILVGIPSRELAALGYNPRKVSLALFAP